MVQAYQQFISQHNQCEIIIQHAMLYSLKYFIRTFF